jgi:hypothetical protein
MEVRLATLFPLDLNSQDEDEGEEDSGPRSGGTRAPGRARS